MAKNNINKNFWVVFITGLGFFIDSFDFFTYHVTRVASLTDLGLSGDELTRQGIFILNCLVAGSFVGGLFWGLLGDKIGRKKALLASILVYSAAMVANSFVQTVESFAWVRFFVGVGIAGEVGLGATLIGEILPKSKRTLGLAFFTVFGLLGVATAALSSEFIYWRTLFLMGGVIGLLVLLLRHWLMESKMFLDFSGNKNYLQPLKEIFTSSKLTFRYIGCVLLLAPNFFVTGFLLTLSPEFAKAIGIQEPVKASIMMGLYFVVAAIGDLLGAGLTTYTQSRRKALLVFILGNFIIAVLYLFAMPTTAKGFYLIGILFGFFNVWALSATVSVEQFPTHLRATVSTSVLNFARTLVIAFNLCFLALKPNLGAANAAAIIGVVIMSLGLFSAWRMRETYHADLDKIEV